MGRKAFSFTGVMKKVKRERKRTGAVLLAASMVWGQVPTSVFAVERSGLPTLETGISQIGPEVLEQLSLERLNRGLIGFDGDYQLPDDQTPVNVIVQFENPPAGVQVVEAELEGDALTLAEAEQIVEEDHALFQEELQELFSGQWVRNTAYEINAQYREALNGVSLTLPANLVSEVAGFESVRAVYPDVMVTLDPVDVVQLADAINSLTASAPYVVAAEASASVTQLSGNSNDLHIVITETLSDGTLVQLERVTFSIRNNASGTFDVHGYEVFVNTQGNTQIREIRIVSYPEWERPSEPVRNPLGMQPGRETMRADEMQALGYRGAGVVVAVLDTGIDYYHPAFAGAFLTLEEAQERNPGIPDDAGIYGYFKGRNFVDDVALFPTLYGAELGDFDPMETTYEMWRHSGLPEFNPTGGGRFLTMHGTHVAGTIVGRDAGNPNSILGVAPEARMIAYRVLGPRGSGMMSGVLLGIEYAVNDGADVVNMSLGGGSNTPAGFPTTTAVNNAMIANPNITFVLSAGNSGPNFYTTTSPAPATPAITVSNIVEAGATGVVAEIGGETFELALGTTPSTILAVDPDTGRLVSGNAGLVSNEDGEFALFTLPRLNVTNSTPGPVPGVGTAAEFEALLETFGEEELAGAFVLVRRGYAFTEVAANAVAAGLGGVIVINNTDANDASGIPELPLPYVFIGLSDGIALYGAIDASEPSVVQFPEFIYSPLRLNPSSSRGPVGESFEIKPDIGANGTSVLSAVPAWWVGDGGADDTTVAYALASGTSMSAPHVAGAVALLIDYSRQNGGEWTSEEIKVRLMNTAIPFEEGFYSVFDKGTGYADVYAAAFADSFVYVTYDRVALEFGLPFAEQDFVTARTGSFSFGGVDLFRSSGGLDRTMTATIVNTSNAAQTYTISSEFILGGRQVQNPAGVANLELSATTITVPANSSVDFEATLTVSENAPHGFYEGFVVVENDAGQVAALPFAGVLTFDPPTLTDVYLYRPVLTTGEFAQNFTSRELGLVYTPHHGFGYNIWIYKNVDGLDATNWDTEAFDDAYIGFGGSRTLQAAGFGNALGRPHRGIVFEGHYLNAPGVLPWNTLAEGEYVLILEVFRQIGSAFQFEKDILLPFSVDNTAPELTIDGLFEESGSLYVELGEGAETGFLLTGNVYDAWVAEANQREVTFDLWRNPEIINQSVNAVWIQIGDAPMVRAEVDADGNFEIGVEADVLPAAAVAVAIDSYSILPRVDTELGVSNPWIIPGQDEFRLPGGFLNADPSLNPQLRLAGLWNFNPNPLFNEHIWSGVNQTTLTFTIIEAQ